MLKTAALLGDKSSGEQMARKNPLDSALSAKEKLAAQRRAEDIQAWETWKKQPTPENTHVLLNRFEPVFRQKVRDWKAPNTRTGAFKANLKLHAGNAFESYDPNRGASLRTHVENHLKKSMRFNQRYQNARYMPEGQTELIGPIQKAHGTLMDQLGRDPTHREIASYINQTPELIGRRKPLSAAKVKRISTAALEKDIIGSTFESDPTPRASKREFEVIGQLRPTLTRDEQEVFDYLYGQNGKPRIGSTSQLAGKLGKSQSQVSRLKSGILAKYKHYY